MFSFSRAKGQRCVITGVDVWIGFLWPECRGDSLVIQSCSSLYFYFNEVKSEHQSLLVSRPQCILSVSRWRAGTKDRHYPASVLRLAVKVEAAASDGVYLCDSWQSKRLAVTAAHRYEGVARRWTVAKSTCLLPAPPWIGAGSWKERCATSTPHKAGRR